MVVWGKKYPTSNSRKSLSAFKKKHNYGEEFKIKRIKSENGKKNRYVLLRVK